MLLAMRVSHFIFLAEVKLRLTGSSSQSEGRVEVLHKGMWGTICDDHWGLQEATVVCRMLNYSSSAKAISSAHRYYGPGNLSYPIWLTNVKCQGDEQNIADCRHDGWNVHRCYHYQDAAVECTNRSIPPSEGTSVTL